MGYTAQIIGGKHSGLTFEIEQLTSAIEVPGTLDDGDLTQFVYWRQPTISPIKDGGLVIYTPERQYHP